MLRGDKGSEVSVSLTDPNDGTTRTIRLRREIINASSVVTRTLAHEVVYLRISNFAVLTPRKVAEALKAAFPGQLPRGVVLDLRGNPGGTLDSAIGVADLFVPDGVLLSIVGRDSEKVRTFKATDGGAYEELPVVVLTDRGTAAASEIVADALRTLRQSKLVGERTFGRGTIQTIYPLHDGSAIKITTGRWKTASGELLEGNGLTPDVEARTASAGLIDASTDPTVALALQTLLEGQAR